MSSGLSLISYSCTMLPSGLYLPSRSRRPSWSSLSRWSFPLRSLCSRFSRSRCSSLCLSTCSASLSRSCTTPRSVWHKRGCGLPSVKRAPNTAPSLQLHPSGRTSTAPGATTVTLRTAARQLRPSSAIPSTLLDWFAEWLSRKQATVRAQTFFAYKASALRRRAA